MNLSCAAARLLRELVEEARHDIHTGHVSYGTDARNADILGELDELDELAGVTLTQDTVLPAANEAIR